MYWESNIGGLNSGQISFKFISSGLYLYSGTLLYTWLSRQFRIISRWFVIKKAVFLPPIQRLCYTNGHPVGWQDLPERFLTGYQLWSLLYWTPLDLILEDCWVKCTVLMVGVLCLKDHNRRMVSSMHTWKRLSYNNDGLDRKVVVFVWD